MLTLCFAADNWSVATGSTTADGAIAGNAKVGNRINLVTAGSARIHNFAEHGRRAFASLNCLPLSGAVVPGRDWSRKPGLYFRHAAEIRFNPAIRRLATRLLRRNCRCWTEAPAFANLARNASLATAHCSACGNILSTVSTTLCTSVSSQYERLIFQILFL